WYASGEAAILMVDSKYSGPLLVRAFQLGGDGRSMVTLDGSGWPGDGVSFKEIQHGVAVVSAIATPGGGLFLAAVTPSRFWRALFGTLSTDSPGCFGLQIDGDVFTEFIVFEENTGKPPPG
ncbi:MAG TPA: hypothetical protein VHQ03_03455, partial [Candidatus Dormibacteraeota bacterium]|nr:hypothetical protein [Candidatus Dormibacteraeota bacterium]